jgi:hypothetical protein
MLLLGFGVAQAQERTVEVRERRNPVAIVAADTLWGGLAGGAVSGGIIGYRMGIENRNNYDWKPVLATGLAIGVGAGLLWGIVDATSGGSGPGYSLPNGRISDGLSYGATHVELSGAVTAPVAFGHF